MYLKKAKQKLEDLKQRNNKLRKKFKQFDIVPKTLAAQKWGYYFFTKTRYSLLRRNRSGALFCYEKARQYFSRNLNLAHSPFSRENLKQFPEFQYISNKVKELPKRIQGFSIVD